MKSKSTPVLSCVSSQHEGRGASEHLAVDELQKELHESQLRINSLRIELQRAEREIFKVERLIRILTEGEVSYEKFIETIYLAISCTVPDIVKWFFRPVTRYLRQQIRRISSTSKAPAYRIKAHPAGRQQKRVLHAIANFMTGGSSRLVVDLIENLGGIYHQEVITGFVPVPAAYQGAVVHEWRSQQEILSFLKKFAPDVIHVHYWGDVDFGWYDKIFRAAEEIGCKVIENVNTPVIPYRSHVVRKYIYVSDYVMREFGRTDEHGAVIYPGSDIGYYSRDGLENVPDDCVGMVYRLEGDKLNAESINVFISVVKRRPSTKVIIVGAGSFLDLYKESVFLNGVENSFLFTGEMAYVNLPAIYAQMSIFVAPVWKESFGQVSVFAMGMGLPVVGYQVGGVAEIIANDELLAPVGDCEKLASIIIDLLDDREKRQAVGAINQLRAKSKFSVEAMVREYDVLYRTVVGDNE